MMPQFPHMTYYPPPGPIMGPPVMYPPQMQQMTSANVRPTPPEPPKVIVLGNYIK